MKKDIRRKILQMVEVGFTEDKISRLYDFINMGAILVNLTVTILYTYDNIRGQYSGILSIIESITVFFFLIDYGLRILTAPLLFPDNSSHKAIVKYAISFNGIVDILSFLPYYLPIFFPSGTVAFRMLRMIRIFRIFRINAYYDSLNAITAVLVSKKQQLLSSVFIISILMIASSLCMYSLEHTVQPGVFSNAFSGIWWSASTLLTVGYGDIYPITAAGKALGIIITFLGVGMVAIPTGIISAGFVEQYAKLRESSGHKKEQLEFIKVHIKHRDPWSGKRIDEILFPKDMIVAAVQRNNDTIVPRGDVIILEGDTVVLGTKSYKDNWDIVLQEIRISSEHPWVNTPIRDLDISRQTFIITIKRGNDTLVPRGDFILRHDDVVLVYTKKKIADANKITI